MGIDISWSAGLWLSAVDNSRALHQSNYWYGNSYGPGPLDSLGSIDYKRAWEWKRIWKINRSEINSFQRLVSRNLTTVPKSILQWPAKGNPYAAGNLDLSLTVSDDMAPFVDTDHDGIYDPLKGDYPDMKGDQMLWWIFNDNRPGRPALNGKPLKVEIQAQAYGYNRGSVVDRMLFYEYKMINKSGESYEDMSFGFFNIPVLGLRGNEYVGFDSTRRMALLYESEDMVDADGAYGWPPIVGVCFVELPGDNFPASMQPAGAFNTIYNSAADPFPTCDTEFNHVMHMRTAFGNPKLPDGGRYMYPYLGQCKKGERG